MIIQNRDKLVIGIVTLLSVITLYKSATSINQKVWFFFPTTTESATTTTTQIDRNLRHHNTDNNTPQLTTMIMNNNSTSSTTTLINDDDNNNSNSNSNSNNNNELGAIVFLAPPRNSGVGWNDRKTDRFCMLMRAIRSVDQHLNSKYGPYPIYVLVSKDYHLAIEKKDGMYTQRDRDVIRSWAPHSPIIEFIEIDMYSNDALEPNTTRSQIQRWRKGQDGGVKGRDVGYQSMCRLWSGRLQQMNFLDGHQYYMRMDDDSLLTHDLQFDPFIEMKNRSLTYAWRRDDKDIWGVDKLWQISKPHIIMEAANHHSTDLSSLPFMNDDDDDNIAAYTYTGRQPYNNFFASSVKFWRSNQWINLWNDLNSEHAFFKYRVGDANVHAIAVMMMHHQQQQQQQGNNNEMMSYVRWPDFPYVHNINDDKDFVGMGNLHQFECNEAYKKKMNGW